MKRTGIYIFDDHLSVGINEVPIHGTVVVVSYLDEGSKMVSKLSNVGITNTTTIFDFLELEEDIIWSALGGGGGELELLEENDIEGWRLLKRNEDHYGNIGKDAVDLSITDGGYPNSGATGQRSFASGFNTHSIGNYSFGEGLTTVTEVTLITGPIGGGSIPGGELPEGAYNIYGVPEGSIVYYGVPEGSVVYYGVPEGAVVYHGLPESAIQFHGVPEGQGTPSYDLHVYGEVV